MKEVIILSNQGKFEQAKGNAKETLGNVTGSDQLEKEG